MPRFFVSALNIGADSLLIDEEQSRHIEKVLRLKRGDIIKVFDGNGNEYQVRLQEKKQKKLQAEILIKESAAEKMAIDLTLVQGIVRSEKMDYIIQKAVEIGVKSIIPLQSKYSVARYDKEKKERKIERWQKIAREACKQCGRNYIPEVKPILDFSVLMALIGDKPALLCYEQERELRFRSLLREQRDSFRSQGLFLIIGPEGGFSSTEIEMGREQGLFILGMGSRILRSETASLLACGIIMYEYGELG